MFACLPHQFAHQHRMDARKKIKSLFVISKESKNSITSTENLCNPQNFVFLCLKLNMILQTAVVPVAFAPL
jgi:hypothetical protein